MLRSARWIVGIIVGLLVLVLVLGWLVLQSSLFSGMRRDLVQSMLSEQIGQPVFIRDDVKMQVKRYSTIHTSDLVIPSENIEDVNLAELDTLSFKLDLFSLLKGKVDLDELVISQLNVNFLRREDGTTSWTKETIWDPNIDYSKEVETEDPASPAEEHLPQDGNGASSETGTGEGDLIAASETPHTGFFQFFNGKTVQIDDIRLLIDNKWTGFEFDFLLNELSLEQLEGGREQRLAGDGVLNDRQFNLSGSFPRSQKFQAVFELGDGSLSVEGVPFPEERGEGYEAKIVFDPASLGDLLETIGLKRSFDGTGELTADLTVTPASVTIANLDAGIEFLKGQAVAINGEIGNLLEPSGIDINVDANLRSRDQSIATATQLSEIRLTDLYGHIVSAGTGIELEELKIQTNAFQTDLRKLGPISVRRIHRTPEGELSLSDVDVLLGPERAPVIRAQGDVRDIFAFKGVDFEGELDASADLVLKRLDPEDVAQFGSLKGEFSISDGSGQLALTAFRGYSYGSDLWSLKSEFSVTDVAEFADLDLEYELGIADGARFLEALKLKPLDTGNIGFSGTLTGSKADLSAHASAVINRSRIDAALDTEIAGEKLIARGGMQSEEIHIADLRDVVGAALQIQTLLTRKEESKPAQEIQPLVIGDDQNSAEQTEELSAKNNNDSAKTDEKEILPLVIEDKPEEVELVSRGRLLEILDLEFGVDIGKIVGQEGVSGVHGDLTIKDGILQMGPLEASYGDGNFKTTATTNLLTGADTVRLAGSTNGWDFGEILESVGLGIDAYGALSASFDLSGQSASVQSFLSSMNGNATIRMRDGRIATSLIELAGLGIFKWLFSEERRQGYTDIVCVNAPVRLSSGSVSSDQVVAETRSVQVVAKGQANIRDRSIELRVEPRPIGRPFARSAFPVEISGTLDDPKFRVLFAGLPGEKTGPHPMMAKKPLQDHTPCELSK
jgi:AsmA family protein